MRLPGGVVVDVAVAARLIGILVAGVIGLSVLPKVLERPDPGPIPADVGFRPGENPMAPVSIPASDPGQGGRPGGLATGGDGDRPRPRSSRGGKEGPSRTTKVTGDSSRGDESGRRPDSRDRAGPTTGPPAPAPSVAPIVTGPAPLPYSPAPPAVPGDGSAEFAPR